MIARALRIVAGSVGLIVTFAVALVLGAYWHINLPASKRVAAVEVSRLLATILEGRIVIEHIDRVGLRGASGIVARATTVEGRDVVRVSDVNAEMSVIDLLRSVLLGHDAMEIVIRRVRVGRADVSLDPDFDGAIAIAKIFIPRPSTTPPNPSGAKGRPVNFRILHADIKEANVHQVIADTPIQALLSDVACELSVEDGHVAIDLSQARADLRGVIEPDIRVDIDKSSMRYNSPYLDITARSHVAKGTLDAETRIIVGKGKEPVRIEGKAHARNVDSHHVKASFPTTNVGLEATYALALTNGRFPEGHATIKTFPSVVAGETIPPSTIVADTTKTTLTAKAEITEEGAPTKVEAYLDERLVRVTARSTIGDIRGIPRLATAMHGGMPGGVLLVDAHGSYTFETRAVDAKAHVHAENITFAGVVVRTAEGDAHATGKIDALIIDANASGRNFAIPGFDASRIDAKTRIHMSDITTLRDVDATVERAGVLVHATAKTVGVDGGKLTVENARIEGFGQPVIVSASRDEDSIAVRASAPGVELERIGRFLRMENNLRKGHVTLDADVAIQGSSPRGKIALSGSNLSLFTLKKADVAATASFERKALTLDVEVRVPDVATVHVATKDLLVDGNAAQPRAWTHARGRIDIDSAVDLCNVSAALPEGSIPHYELCGSVSARGHVSRKTGTSRPDIELEVTTNGLAFAPKPVRDGEKSAWRASGVDIKANLGVNGASGKSSVALELVDARGTIGTLEATAKNVAASLFGGNTVEQLKDLPLEAHVTIPARRLEHFPAIFQVPASAGTVDAKVDLFGSLRAPELTVKAHATELHNAVPTTALDLKYDGHRAVIKLASTARANGSLSVNSTVDAEARDFLAATPIPNPPWKASANVELRNFPMGSVSSLMGVRMRGKIDGTIAVDDFHENARINVRADMKNARFSGARIDSVSVRADIKNGTATAKVSVNQEDGSVDFDANGGVLWGAELVPKLDESRALEANVVARNLRANVFLPFVQGALDDLDGRINGHANAKYHPQAGKPVFAGQLVLSDGLAHVPVLGQELRQLRANINMAPDGTIRIDDISGKGIEGEIKGKALVHLRGLDWVDAEASFDIPKNAPFDLTIRGEPLGEVYGDTKITAKNVRADHRVDVRIEVPTLRVKLATTGQTDVQTLEKMPADMHVGVFLGPQNFIALPMNANDLRSPEPTNERETTIIVIIVIRDLEATRSTQVRVAINGELRAEIAAKLRLTGQLNLREGVVDVQGKKFTIQKGTITFGGSEPANPTVVATAGWTASDGTQVFAEFVGPVKSGKLTLRSEPARSRDEIMALILFGSADANAAGGFAAAGAGAGAGYFAQGINDAIDDISGLQVQARIDTSNARNLRPELEVQIAPDLSAKVTHIIGTPSPLEPPDANLLTVLWRISASWTLETTIGDKFRGVVDAVWQRRY